MNKLKLLIGVVLVFAAGLLAGAVCAGFYYKDQIREFSASGPPMDMKVRMLLDEFSRDLELSESQRIEIEKILRDAQEKFFELRRDIFPQIEELNKASLELIKEKLGEKQRQKFSEFYNKMRKFHDRFAVNLEFPGKPFPRNIDEMQPRLNLKPEQVAQIQKIKEKFFDRREKIMEENSREKPPDFSKIRQKMMELDALESEEIEKVMEDDQLEAYREYMEEKHFRGPPGPGPMGGPDRPFNGPPDGPPGPPGGAPNEPNNRPPLPPPW